MESNNDYVDLKQILHILKKHLGMILAVTIFCGLAGLCVSKFLMKPVYQADATLIVNPGASQNTPVTYDQVTMAKQLVGTYSIIMKSNTVLRQVISDLDMQTDLNSLSGSITVQGVDETEVIQLSVKSGSKENAKAIADDVIRISSPLIIQSVKAGSVEIISPTQVEDKPVSPNNMMNTAIALLLGLSVSIVLAIVIELFKNAFTSDEDIKRQLDISVLGVIPHYDING